MKVASFTVRASMPQSVRWKLAAEAEGFPSVGGWLAGAADAYLKVQAKAGLPVPLAWRKGVFRVALEGGELATVRGYLSPPFGAFSGTPEGPAGYPGRHRFCLVYIPENRILATLSTYGQCRALASEMARGWMRGEQPAADAASLLPKK